MVTIAIIGVAMAVALPVIGAAMRDRRVQQAGITFMDGYRTARSRAMMRGRAHMVSVVTSGTALRQQIYEGDTSSCRMSNWGALPTAALIYDEDFGASRYATDNISMSIANPASATVAQICYTPTGRMFYRLASSGASSAFTDDNGAGGSAPLNGGFLFTVAQTNGQSVIRRVFVPLGGTARFSQ